MFRSNLTELVLKWAPSRQAAPAKRKYDTVAKFGTSKKEEERKDGINK